ncbi:MAG: hypothetical protein PHV08_00815 [Sulfurovaceae bacterium]|nr:hypothetical protein [Sulfurovaceae bacterium]
MDKQTIIKTIMADFEKRTCIKNKKCTPKRYLWTDAFAVCNLLGLFLKTDNTCYKDDALLLIDQVHHVLGKHRSDDLRNGWISGLDEKEGESHPTIGGLRIGKKNNERKENEPFDERLEWEQDGQYFHYLTKWMHALNLATKVTGDPKYNLWACELAKTAHAKFVYVVFDGIKRIYWKMSIDLSYPLVTSMGQHDALDGYITYLELIKTALRDNDIDLDNELISLFQMSHIMDLDTHDPLGIGGLLNSACTLMQLIINYNMTHLSDMLLKLLSSSKSGIDAFLGANTLRYPAEHRLGFRELGLSIGLHGVKKMQMLAKEHPECFSNHTMLQSKLYELASYIPMCDIIEKFWIDPENQKSNTWIEHLDINSVMLATSLDPECFLSV